MKRVLEVPGCRIEHAIVHIAVGIFAIAASFVAALDIVVPASFERTFLPARLARNINKTPSALEISQ